MRLCTVLLSVIGLAFGSDQVPRMPMPIQYENTSNYRWLNKKVLETRLLDDMESIASWSLKNSGEGRGQMALTTERAKDGKHSLRLRAKTMGEKPGRTMGRPPGEVSVVRSVNGEDWSKWNRLSFWVYPDLPGFHPISLLILFHNSGDERNAGWPNRADFVLLKNHQWNHVVSEFAHVARGKVTAVEIQYRLQGNQIEATDAVSFDIDQTELQRVEPDYFEGWGVWPGRIAFSRTGYQAGAFKTAVASGLAAPEFQLIRQDNGCPVLSKPVRTVKSQLGGSAQIGARLDW